MKTHKTHQQVKAIFGLLIQHAISQVNDQGLDTSGFIRLMVQEDLPTGVPLHKDLLYGLLLNLCPVYEEGRKLTLSQMSIEQASQFFDQCRNLLASRGIYVPEPNKDWQRENKA